MVHHPNESQEPNGTSRLFQNHEVLANIGLMPLRFDGSFCGIFPGEQQTNDGTVNERHTDRHLPVHCLRQSSEYIIGSNERDRNGAVVHADSDAKPFI